MAVDDLLAELLRDAGAQRALCLRAHWSIHDDWRRPTKVWIERELCDGLPSLMPEWQGKAANGRWEGLLLEVMRHNRVSIVVATMPNGKLKDSYLADGVAYVELVTLGHWQQDVQRYLGVHWAEIPSTTVSRRAADISRALAVELAEIPPRSAGRSTD